MLPNELYDETRKPLDLTVGKKAKLAALRVQTTWTCARCGFSATSPSPTRLRDLARRHAASHDRTGA